MPSAAKRYLLSPEARIDLERIWIYTSERWSVAQADSYHRKLMGAISDIADNPRRGRPASEIRGGYRRVSTGSHVIFFRKAGDFVEIIRILHGRQDVTRHLS